MTINFNGTSGITFPDSTTQNTGAFNGGLAFRNRLINGAMGIWQRGTSWTSPAYLTYTADRWFVGGNGTTSLSRSTDVPAGYQYSLSTTGTTTQAIGQRIEAVNCQDLVGQSVTLSFWLKQSVGAGTAAITIQAYFPTASDNYTSITQIGSTQSITSTSSWAQYSVTFSSLPSGVANGLEIFIVSASSSSTTFLTTGVQLEKGPTATTFDYRPYGTELALCQRYLPCINTIAGNSDFAVGTTTGAGSGAVVFSFKVTPRTPPTGISVTSVGSFTVTTATVSAVCSAISFSNAGYDGGRLNYSAGSTFTASQPVIMYGTAAGGQIQFTGCEL